MCVLNLIISSFELGVSLLTALCITKRDIDLNMQHSFLLGRERVHFLGEEFFVQKVQFCGSGSVRVTVLCSEVWCGEGEKSRKSSLS